MTVWSASPNMRIGYEGLIRYCVRVVLAEVMTKHQLHVPHRQYALIDQRKVMLLLHCSLVFLNKLVWCDIAVTSPAMRLSCRGGIALKTK
jgi:hypothetical protein